MSQPLIALRNLEKAFPLGKSQTFVLRKITLDIAEGDFVSIMGPSGAGKSTLLHILGMHDADWTGEYDFLDQPVHALKTKHRQALGKEHIGFVFQSYHLLDDLTVAENLDVPLSYRNVRRSERQSLVADTLDRFQIVGKKDLYPSQLSGGQQEVEGRDRPLEHAGIYAVVSYDVRRQTRELGIRLALGASRATVLRAVMARSVLFAGGGIVVGVGIALAVGQLMASMVYEIQPTDPLTFVAASLALVMVAVVAAYVPAQRATRIEPAARARLTTAGFVPSSHNSSRPRASTGMPRRSK